MCYYILNDKFFKRKEVRFEHSVNRKIFLRLPCFFLICFLQYMSIIFCLCYNSIVFRVSPIFIIISPSILFGMFVPLLYSFVTLSLILSKPLCDATDYCQRRGISNMCQYKINRQDIRSGSKEKYLRI